MLIALFYLYIYIVSAYQVHVSGAGDFQLSKIDILKDPFPTNGKKDHNAMDSDDKIGLQVWAYLDVLL